MSDGGYTKDEAWNLPLQATAAKLCETERDMLLDFCGLETGKVVWGAAMSECLSSLRGAHLMDRHHDLSSIQYAPTAKGRDVAAIIHAERQARTKQDSGTGAK